MGGVNPDLYCGYQEVVRSGQMVCHNANLIRFGLKADQTDSLMRELVLQTLMELTELYSVRYAALQQHHSALNG
jgi:hypothetical protein